MHTHKINPKDKQFPPKFSSFWCPTSLCGWCFRSGGRRSCPSQKSSTPRRAHLFESDTCDTASGLQTLDSHTLTTYRLKAYHKHHDLSIEDPHIKGYLDLSRRFRTQPIHRCPLSAQTLWLLSPAHWRDPTRSTRCSESSSTTVDSPARRLVKPDQKIWVSHIICIH